MLQAFFTGNFLECYFIKLRNGARKLTLRFFENEFEVLKFIGDLDNCSLSSYNIISKIVEICLETLVVFESETESVLNSLAVRFHLLPLILSIDELLLEVDELPLSLDIICAFDVLKGANCVVR
jgi:hypothetical protein